MENKHISEPQTELQMDHVSTNFAAQIIHITIDVDNKLYAPHLYLAHLGQSFFSFSVACFQQCQLPPVT